MQNPNNQIRNVTWQCWKISNIWISGMVFLKNGGFSVTIFCLPVQIDNVAAEWQPLYGPSALEPLDVEKIQVKMMVPSNWTSFYTIVYLKDWTQLTNPQSLNHLSCSLGSFFITSWFVINCGTQKHWEMSEHTGRSSLDDSRWFTVPQGSGSFFCNSTLFLGDGN